MSRSIKAVQDAQLIADAGLIDQECRQAGFGTTCNPDSPCDYCKARDEWLTSKYAEMEATSDDLRQFRRMAKAHPGALRDIIVKLLEGGAR